MKKLYRKNLKIITKNDKTFVKNVNTTARFNKYKIS